MREILALATLSFLPYLLAIGIGLYLFIVTLQVFRIRKDLDQIKEILMDATGKLEKKEDSVEGPKFIY